MDEIAGTLDMGPGAPQADHGGPAGELAAARGRVGAFSISDERRAELERLEREAGVEHDASADGSSRFPIAARPANAEPRPNLTGCLPNPDIDKH